jgi:hypothetical protein
MYANGALGSSGQVLTTNSTGGVYWSTVSSGGGSITSIVAGNGLTGGGSSGTVTLTVAAGNNTIYINSTGISVNTTTIASSNPGNWANATNGFVAGSANNAAYLGGTAAASYLTTSSTYSGTLTSSQVTTALTYTPYNGATNPNGYVNSTSGTANNAAYLGGVVAASYATQSYVTGNPIQAANSTNGFAINGTSNNATLFAGYSWAAPAALGGTTANSGNFTTVTSSGLTQAQNFRGTAPTGGVGNGQFIAVAGTTFASFYNDSTNFYILKSATSNTVVDSSRPFIVNLSTSAITIDQSGAGTTFGGAVSATSFSGSGSGLTGTGANFTANNSNYLGGTAAASYAPLSGSSTITSSASPAFSATTTSGIALQVGDNSAIRNTVSTGGTMYFDVGTGGATTGSFIFRTSSSFTTITTFNGSGTQTTSLGVGTASSGTAGEIRATNNITAYYSDERLKDIEGTITCPIEKIKQISGVYYRSNEIAASYGYTDKKKQIGVIAQEIEAVLPEIVVPAPFDIGKDDNGNEYSISGENYKTVQYEKLIPLLIEAIKEQQRIIEAQNDKIEMILSKLQG